MSPSIIGIIPKPHLRKGKPELKNPKFELKKTMKEDRKLLQIEIPLFTRQKHEALLRCLPWVGPPFGRR
jgi:hypothetical protein